ncbi:MAG: GntR family transcriptional regulator [Deltaproteobacteria bacterium]|nr:GntR family transcriptional regulator [Deltaproteobacteria bacterium]
MNPKTPPAKPAGGKAAFSRRSLGQEVTDLLRHQILAGEHRPGQRLVELNLAQEMNISRTPVREALHRLAQEGLLTKRPRGGYEVRPLSPQEVEEAVGVRAALESYAARLAAGRATSQQVQDLEQNLTAFQAALENRDEDTLVALNAEFHHLLAEAAGSLLLSRLLGELEEVVERISRALITTMPAGGWSTDEHRELVEAIARGDGDTAARLAASHVERGGAWILSRMRQESLEL